MSSNKKEIKLELAFPYDIHITPTVNGGCIVNVGCAQLSYSTPARMITDLKKYLADPQGYEKAYNECNKTRGGNALAEPDRPTAARALGSGRTVGSRPAGEVVETLPEQRESDQERAEAPSEQESAERIE